MEQAARERLLARQEELLTQLDATRTVLMFSAIINCLMWLVIGTVWVFQWQSPGKLYSVHAYYASMALWIALVLACLWLVAVLERRWRERAWQRRHVRLLQLLRETNGGMLILEPAYWDNVRELLNQYPWLKLLEPAQPRNLEQQVAYAAAHWRILISTTVSQDRLRRMVLLGSLERLGERLLVGVINRYTFFGLIAIGFASQYLSHWAHFYIWQNALNSVFYFCSAVVITACYPLAILCTLGYVHNRIAQVAIIDFLLE